MGNGLLDTSSGTLAWLYSYTVHCDVLSGIQVCRNMYIHYTYSYIAFSG